jgi:hypothetical protein
MHNSRLVRYRTSQTEHPVLCVKLSIMVVQGSCFAFFWGEGLICIREQRFTRQRDRTGDTNGPLYSEVKIVVALKLK